MFDAHILDYVQTHPMAADMSVTTVKHCLHVYAERTRTNAAHSSGELVEPV